MTNFNMPTLHYLPMSNIMLHRLKDNATQGRKIGHWFCKFWGNIYKFNIYYCYIYFVISIKTQIYIWQIKQNSINNLDTVYTRDKLNLV